MECVRYEGACSPTETRTLCCSLDSRLATSWCYASVAAFHRTPGTSARGCVCRCRHQSPKSSAQADLVSVMLQIAADSCCKELTARQGSARCRFEGPGRRQHELPQLWCWGSAWVQD